MPSEETRLAKRLKADPVPAHATTEDPYPPIGYAWYVVGVLTLLYVFSFMDRYILSLLVGPIRRDLGISDTGMSLLMGFSFAVFYSLFGIPLGRLADSRSRRTLIAIGCVVWSLMTAGSGLARNYLQLLLFRMGVGVGEATLSPSAYSLITDYFPKERLASAMSVYSTAIHIGTGLSYILGGLVVGYASTQGESVLPIVGAVRPWQTVFFIVGLPGLALAVLMYTVKEPVRRGLRFVKAEDGIRRAVQAPLRDVFRYFAENKATLICHNVGFTLSTLTSYTTWGPTLFIRNYGWSAAQAGVLYGLLTSIIGVMGILAGGRIADFLAERGYRDANLRFGLIVTVAWFPTGLLFPLMPNATWAVALLIPTYFLVSAPWGAAAAALQQVMPNSMRGQATAIYLLAINLIGGGLGPTAVALVTDYIFHDDYSLKYSLVIIGTISHLASALLLWIGLKHFRKSLDRMEVWTTANG